LGNKLVKINEILGEASGRFEKWHPGEDKGMSDPTHGGGKFNAPQGDFVPQAPYEYAIALPGIGAAAAGISKVAKVGSKLAKVVARGNKVKRIEPKLGPAKTIVGKADPKLGQLRGITTRKIKTDPKLGQLRGVTTGADHGVRQILPILK
jgi:hypothetical protein